MTIIRRVIDSRNPNRGLPRSNAMTTNPLWYDLRNSVYRREFVDAQDLLTANPNLLDLRNSIGETVLHFLAVENDLEGVRWLHARGFTLNTRNRFGEPMIFEVAALGHKELLLWLAHQGVDFSVVDRANRRILTYLRKNRDEARKRRGEEMAQFLLENLPGLAQTGTASET